MVEAKLKQLAEQIQILIDLEEDGLESCITEFSFLLTLLEKEAAKASDTEALAGVDTIKRIIGQDYQKVRDEISEEIDFLKRQHEVIEQTLSLQKKDSSKFAEVANLVLEEAGDLEDTESFRKKMTESHQVGKADLLATLEEIKGALAEGDVQDLAAYFEASEMDQAEEFYSNDEEAEAEDDEEMDCDDEALCDENVSACEENLEGCACRSEGLDLTSNQKLMEMLKKYSDPYFVEDQEKGS